MRYLTAQDLLNLLSNKTNIKITELMIHHWFTMYGRDYQKPTSEVKKNEQIVE